MLAWFSVHATPLRGVPLEHVHTFCAQLWPWRWKPSSQLAHWSAPEDRQASPSAALPLKHRHGSFGAAAAGAAESSTLPKAQLSFSMVSSSLPKKTSVAVALVCLIVTSMSW